MAAAHRIPVLMYHRVGNVSDPWERKYCIEPRRFAGHMRALDRAGWQAVSVDRFMVWLDGQASLPERSFLLTFDDGFESVLYHAHPVLNTLGWPATMFLVGAFIGQEDRWSASEHPKGHIYPLLGAEQITRMQNTGWSFHGHSRHHKDLTSLNADDLAMEVLGCRNDLAALGIDASYFAYPYGRYAEREVAAVKAAGYTAAFTVQPGFNRPGVDKFRIRRIDIFGTDSPAMLLRKIKFGSNDGSLMAVARYYAGRLLQRMQRG